MSRALVLVLAVSLALVGALAPAAEGADTLPDLRRKLLEANTEARVGRALDLLTEKIGTDGFFADHAAFAEWLGALPDGRTDHPLVRLRRGWALVRAKRGKEAILHLEAALKNDPSSGLTRAYLGEALRQGGRPMEAVEMLVSAVTCGEQGKHLDESFRESIFALRRGQIAGHADDLPDYAVAANRWLEVRPDPMWHHSVAKMLLEDWATYEVPGRKRGDLWAGEAGRHALASIRTATAPIEGQDQLAYDAALALEALDRSTGGRTDRFDLLAWAYRLGRLPGDGGHKFPQVITWLAEAAAAEQRFALAFRLAQKRLEVSDSPQARRLLRTLPPDLELDG